MGRIGVIQAGQAGVRDHDRLAAQLIAMSFQERFQADASNLFFAFQHKRQIAWELGIGFQIGFDRLQMREILPFIVAGAPPEKRTSLNARLKGRRFPQIERLCRLHIVMPVNDELWFA